MDLYTDLSTLSTFLCVDYMVYIGSKKNGRFVDCDKTAKNRGVWQKNADVFIIGNLSKYTEYSDNSILIKKGGSSFFEASACLMFDSLL